MLNITKSWDHKVYKNDTRYYGNENWVVPELETFLKKYPYSYTYAIVTRDSVGNLAIHQRISLPCWGELRKYANTHPADQVTQKYPPKKPSDLHYPFPDGKPEALACAFPLKQDDEFASWRREYCFGESSPFRRGYQRDFLQLAMNDDGSMNGIILTDTKFDPTVLVNMLKRIDVINAFPLKMLFEAGFTDDEVKILLTTVYINTRYCEIQPMTDYIQGVKCNLNKILTGDTTDLTGGTFGDRFDYNRKYMHDIFKDEDKTKNVSLSALINDRGASSYPTLKIVKNAISEAIAEGLEIGINGTKQKEKEAA